MVFEKIWNFQLLFVSFFLNFQKNRSQKLAMLEKNKDSFWIYIEFRTKLYKEIFDFFLFFFSVFPKIFFFDLQLKKIMAENWKSLYIVLCGIRCRFQNCLCFFLALIVFDFYSFEGSKTHFTFYRRGKYIYIYMIKSKRTYITNQQIPSNTLIFIPIIPVTPKLPYHIIYHAVYALSFLTIDLELLDWRKWRKVYWNATTRLS